MTNRKYVLFFIFCCFALSTSQALWCGSQKDTAFEKARNRIALALSFGALCLISASDDARADLLQQINPKALMHNAARTYASCAFTTFMHEVGHALAYTLLTGKKSSIRLGSLETTKTPLLSCKNIHIEGLNPLQGSTTFHQYGQPHVHEVEAFIEHYRQKCTDHGQSLNIKEILASDDYKSFMASIPPDKARYAAILLAGGTLGALSHLAVERLIRGKCSVDTITCNQAVNALIPLSEKSDGGLLWHKILGIKPSIATAVSEVWLPLDICTEIILAFINSNHEVTKNPHTTILIGIINYILRGYLHFQA